MSVIKDIKLKKIKDSKAGWTVKATVYTKKLTAAASSPSGTSVGAYEVVAFPKKINQIVNQFNKKGERTLIGVDIKNQEKIDQILRLKINKIGGVASTAISVACAKAAAKEHKMPLYKYLNKKAKKLPIPIGKVIGGGKHSKQKSTNFQEFLVIPLKARSIKQGIMLNKKIHHKVGELLKKHTKKRTLKKDYEGGWIAPITDEKALEIISEAISLVDRDVRIGVDIAAQYARRTKEKQFEYVLKLAKKFKLYYIEDPFKDNDFKSHSKLTKALKRSLVCGDDLFATNKRRLEKGKKMKACNATIIKVNQIGTLTDALKAVKYAKKIKYAPVISHRSGETMDNWLADLAVAWEIPFIKIGIAGRERTAKTDRLIYIDNKLAKKR